MEKRVREKSEKAIYITITRYDGNHRSDYCTSKGIFV